MTLADLANLKLYSTHSHPCSYLSEEQATTLFVDPYANLDATSYSFLSAHGFRRSGKHVYRPRCETCQACIPIRVLSQQFSPNRSQKRCLKRNKDLKVSQVPTIDTSEHYALYERYISERHADGDMYPASKNQYLEFLCPAWGITRYLEFRDPQKKLVAVTTCDLLSDGVSAIYTFFDPDESQRSLGVFSVLYQIAWAQELRLPYVYLGYWIKQCSKMQYKSHYNPYQIYWRNNWISPSNQE